MEITNIAFEAKEVEPTAIDPLQPVWESKVEAVVHYVLLAVIMLSLGCVCYYVRSSINQINDDMQQVYATIVTGASCDQTEPRRVLRRR